MDENLRETTELPGSGGTAPNEENERDEEHPLCAQRL